MNDTIFSKAKDKGIHSLSEEEKDYLIKAGFIRKCNCCCHSKDGPTVLHFMPCCDDGYEIVNYHFINKVKSIIRGD